MYLKTAEAYEAFPMFFLMIANMFVKSKIFPARYLNYSAMLSSLTMAKLSTQTFILIRFKLLM